MEKFRMYIIWKNIPEIKLTCVISFLTYRIYRIQIIKRLDINENIS